MMSRQIPIEGAGNGARLFRCQAGVTCMLLGTLSCGPHPETTGGLVVLPDTVIMTIGDTLTLAALAFDTAQAIGLSRAPILWATRNNAIVDVSANGLTRARSTGITFVTAATEHVRDSAVIEVVTAFGLPVRFAAMVQPIFSTKCATAGCHGGPSPPLDLDLSDGRSHENVYNVTAREEPSLKLIEPYRTDRSWLLMELEAHFHMDDTEAGGLRSRRGVHEDIHVTPEDVATLRRWVQAGAPNN